MCIDRVSEFEAWAVNHGNFPNKWCIKRSRRSYSSDICQVRYYFQFHMKITGRYQSVKVLLTHTVHVTSAFHPWMYNFKRNGIQFITELFPHFKSESIRACFIFFWWRPCLESISRSKNKCPPIAFKYILYTCRQLSTRRPLILYNVYGSSTLLVLRSKPTMYPSNIIVTCVSCSHVSKFTYRFADRTCRAVGHYKFGQYNVYNVFNCIITIFLHSWLFITFLNCSKIFGKSPGKMWDLHVFCLH